MKKLLSLIVILSLLLVCMGSLGEETLTDAMSRITLNVKTVLDIPDDYTDFSGNFSDGRWYLSWQSNNASVSVMARPDGTVLNYGSYSYNDPRDRNTNLMNARLPKFSVEELETAARSFADSVIVKNGWDYCQDSFMPGLYREYYSETTFTGYLTYNGILTDIFFHIEIDSQTGKVTSFYRSDAYSELVLPEKAADRTSLSPIGDAETVLLNAYEMEAVYSVIKTNEMAKLVYVLKNQNLIAVDAYTGKLIDFDEAGYAANGAEEDAAEAEMTMDAGFASAKQTSLSDAEKTGIALYDGVKTVDELETLLRDTPEFGLDSEYKLISSDYYLRNKAPVVRLIYQKGVEQDTYISKYFTADAVTGRVLTLYTYNYTDYALRTASKAEDNGFKANAAEFLGKYYGEYQDELTEPDFTLLKTPEGDYASAAFTFCRAYNGFPFRQDSISMSIDSEGIVTAFNLYWNDGQEFYDISPDQIISPEAAVSAYLGDSAVELMYRTVSEHAETGTAKRVLRLCYCFGGNEFPYAVDAVSAEGYSHTLSGRQVYEYTSTENMLYADEVILLGKYGIGLEESTFTSEDMLYGRQLMQLVLLVAGNENSHDLSDEQLESSVKDLAGVSLSCGEQVSRLQLIKSTVILAGYKNAAELSGIYTLDAVDWDSVPEDLKGYCAVARALDLVDLSEGRLDLDSPALKAQAIHAIYMILSK